MSANDKPLALLVVLCCTTVNRYLCVVVCKNNRNVHAKINWVTSQDQSHAELVKATFQRQGYTQGTYTIIESQAEPKASGVYGGSAGVGNQSTLGSARNTRGSQQATRQKNLSDTLALGRQVSQREVKANVASAVRNQAMSERSRNAFLWIKKVRRSSWKSNITYHVNSKSHYLCPMNCR